MSERALVRFYHPDTGARLGLRLDDLVFDVSDHFATPGVWLRASVDRVPEAIEELEILALQTAHKYPVELFESAPKVNTPHWLAPVWEQDVWAAGVTYERSRQARQEEAIDGGDVYARVYEAERPELFFKAHGSRVIGPGGEVGIRADAQWSVPEPELAVLLNPALDVIGFTVGNDMSSRDIEGANPLYLPQAKLYSAACALGPGITLNPAANWPETTIRLRIERAEQVVFDNEVHTSRIHRRMPDLIDYLGRSQSFPDGVVLLTGTGIVPPDDFTLAVDDVITITIDRIGTLANRVIVV